MPSKNDLKNQVQHLVVIYNKFIYVLKRLASVDLTSGHENATMSNESNESNVSLLTKPFYTTQNLADAIGVSRQIVSLWAKNGIIKAIRAGKNWRIPKEEFERAIREGVRTDDKK